MFDKKYRKQEFYGATLSNLIDVKDFIFYWVRCHRFINWVVIHRFYNNDDLSFKVGERWLPIGNRKQCDSANNL